MDALVQWVETMSPLPVSFWSPEAWPAFKANPTAENWDRLWADAEVCFFWDDLAKLKELRP